MTTARCSALPLGAHCRGALQHARRQPENDSQACSRGKMIHELLELYFSGFAVDWAKWPAGPTFLNWLKTRKIVKGAPEVEMSADLDGVKLTGTADLIYDTTVLDWKTGSGTFLTPIEQDLQMMAYALLLHKAEGFPIVTVKRVLVDERIIMSHDHDFRDGQIEEGITELVHEMAAEGAPKTTGRHCKGCYHRLACEDYRDTARAVLGDELANALIAVGGDLDCTRIEAAIPAAGALLKLARGLVPKKERTPPRKFDAAKTLDRLHEVTDATKEAEAGLVTISITGVEQFLRDRQNYTKIDLAEFWAAVEKDGGRIC